MHENDRPESTTRSRNTPGDDADALRLPILRGRAFTDLDGTPGHEAAIVNERCPDCGGRLVIVAQGISKSYGGRPVVRDFSARIMRGDRVGIVGPNGAGKTTLLNLLTRALMPDTGEVLLGTNLAQVILDQRPETLDPEQSLTEALTGGSGDTVTVAGSYHAGKFLRPHGKGKVYFPEDGTVTPNAAGARRVLPPPVRLPADERERLPLVTVPQIDVRVHCAKDFLPVSLAG